MKKVSAALVLLLVVLAVVVPSARAEEKNGDVCNRLVTAWASKQAGYERAREVRKKAFASTVTRWNKLFDKLDAKGVNTAGVRADATEAASKFDALIAADDALMSAMKSYGQAVCAKSGGDTARSGLKTAQEGRRTARQAYNKALRQLATNLAKLRPAKSTVNTTAK